MDHASAMAARLPTLYREGETLLGVLGHLANQVGFLDEDMAGIRREHWFGQAVDLADAAALGDLLDLPPEPWMDVDTYRSWVDAIVRTTVGAGAVTVAAMQEVVFQYVSRFQSVTGELAVPAFGSAPDAAARPEWQHTTGLGLAPGTPAQPTLAENPPRRRHGPAADARHPQPLQQLSVRQHGLDPAPLSVLVTGLAGGTEACPVLAHLGAAEALVYLGPVTTGERLAIRATGGSLSATLEGRDVTADLRTVTGFTPGQPWTSGAVVPARPLVLQPGDNTLWFLPVAVFDEPGLDRFLLALPSLAVTEGRFDSSAYDRALFSQDALVRLDLTWVETTPAAFSIRLPAGLLTSPAPAAGAPAADPEVARERLSVSLGEAVDRFRGAGVAADVRFVPFTDTAGQHDALTGILPLAHREGGPSGADRLPDSGGVFSVTRFEESTFR